MGRVAYRGAVGISKKRQGFRGLGAGIHGINFPHPFECAVEVGGMFIRGL